MPLLFSCACAISQSGEKGDASVSGPEGAAEQWSAACVVEGTIRTWEGEPIAGATVLLMPPLAPVSIDPLSTDHGGRFRTSWKCSTIARVMVSSQLGRGQADLLVRDRVVDVDLWLNSSSESGAMRLVYGHDAESSKNAGEVIRRAGEVADLVRAGNDPCEARAPLWSAAKGCDDALVRRGYAAAYFSVSCKDETDPIRAKEYLEDGIDPGGWEGLWPESWWNALRESGVESPRTVVDVAMSRPSAEVGARILVDALKDDRWSADERASLYDALRDSRFKSSLTFRALGRDVVPHDVLLEPGDEVPSFRLGGEAEDAVTDADIEGRVVLFYAWGTYCPPCVRGMEMIRDAVAKYGATLMVVMINVGDSEEAIRSFERKHGSLPGVTVRVPSSAGGDYQRLFPTAELPSFILADGQGKVVVTSVQTGFDETMKRIEEVLTRSAGRGD